MDEELERVTRIKKYIDILKEIKSLQNMAEHGEETVQTVEDILNTVSNLSSEDKKPQEVLYEMEIINLCSLVLRDVANNIKTSAELTIDDFIENLNLNMTTVICEPNENRWMKLNDESKRIFPAHLSLSKFIPCENTEMTLPSKRTYQKKSREKEPLSQKSQPTKLMDKHNDKVETDNVNRVYRVLKEMYKNNDRQPLSYLNFVVDPSSFSKTVENIFNVSFLVRDNFVNMATCGNEVVIKPNRSQMTSESMESTSETKQMVVALDFNKWQVLAIFQLTFFLLSPKKSFLKTTTDPK
ncbi:hypothetical protein AAG570_006858 [Ranatra chinensis]|uniref:Non-structural maintenance of chromosomes element 4 n=1 Tax=Ranatra chinensis TaxID=642074 RepID=A0ABD0YVX4_9HEMI